MAKGKTHNELEHIRSENRQLKKIIKYLRKELARKIKREHRYEDLETREAEVQLEEEQAEQVIIAKETCPNCSAAIESIEIGNRKLLSCLNDCGWRKSKKS